MRHGQRGGTIASTEQRDVSPPGRCGPPQELAHGRPITIKQRRGMNYALYVLVFTLSLSLGMLLLSKAYCLW